MSITHIYNLTVYETAYTKQTFIFWSEKAMDMCRLKLLGTKLLRLHQNRLAYTAGG